MIAFDTSSRRTSALVLAGRVTLVMVVARNRIAQVPTRRNPSHSTGNRTAFSASSRSEPIEIRRRAATVPDTGISTRSALEHISDATSAAPRVLRNFIDGEYVEAQTDATTDLVSPVTGQVVATAPVSTAADVDAAYAAAAQGLRGVGPDHPERAAAGAAQVRRRDRGARRRARRARVARTPASRSP